MPYYSLRVVGGDVGDLNELKDMFTGYRDPDYTNSNTILIQRPYDLATLQRNASGVERQGVRVECTKITKRTFDWQKHQ